MKGTGGMGQTKQTAWLAAAALLAVLLFHQAPGLLALPANSTASADFEALVAFMSGFNQDEGTVLVGWDGMVDPCLGNWPGVVCSCDELPRLITKSCNSSIDLAGGLRVRGIDLGPLARADAKRLSGTIHPAVGSLSELVYLDLSDNLLT